MNVSYEGDVWEPFPLNFEEGALNWEELDEQSNNQEVPI